MYTLAFVNSQILVDLHLSEDNHVLIYFFIQYHLDLSLLKGTGSKLVQGKIHGVELKHVGLCEEIKFRESHHGLITLSHPL